MSYQDLQDAMILAPKCKFFTTTGGKSYETIQKSEELLGIKFSKQNIEFYLKYGYLSFYGNEIFGIDPDDNSGILEGNSVAYALNDRKEYDLPKEWLPIYNFQDGNKAYLDYSSLNSEREPKVIMAIYNGINYEKVDNLSEDFGEFLLLLVREQLESQK